MRYKSKPEPKPKSKTVLIFAGSEAQARRYMREKKLTPTQTRVVFSTMSVMGLEPEHFATVLIGTWWHNREVRYAYNYWLDRCTTHGVSIGYDAKGEPVKQTTAVECEVAQFKHCTDCPTPNMCAIEDECRKDVNDLAKRRAAEVPSVHSFESRDPLPEIKLYEEPCPCGCRKFVVRPMFIGPDASVYHNEAKELVLRYNGYNEINKDLNTVLDAFEALSSLEKVPHSLAHVLTAALKNRAKRKGE